MDGRDEATNGAEVGSCLGFDLNFGRLGHHELNT